MYDHNPFKLIEADRKNSASKVYKDANPGHEPKSWEHSKLSIHARGRGKINNPSHDPLAKREQRHWAYRGLRDEDIPQRSHKKLDREQAKQAIKDFPLKEAVIKHGRVSYQTDGHPETAIFARKYHASMGRDEHALDDYDSEDHNSSSTAVLFRHQKTKKSFLVDIDSHDDNKFSIKKLAKPTIVSKSHFTPSNKE